jgi:hypothetical protein
VVDAAWLGSSKLPNHATRRRASLLQFRKPVKNTRNLITIVRRRRGMKNETAFGKIRRISTYFHESSLKNIFEISQ